jgi:signal transduction histidine kinase
VLTYRSVSKEVALARLKSDFVSNVSHELRTPLEYEFTQTNLAELVTNTLDVYRDQIGEQGFTFEQSIDTGLPPVQVDREAIARSLVNLVNNALKSRRSCVSPRATPQTPCCFQSWPQFRTSPVPSR